MAIGNDQTFSFQTTGQPQPEHPAQTPSRPGKHTPPHPHPTSLQASILAQADKWQAAQQLLQEGQILELLVIDYNKGGVIVHWNGLQGFVPASQIDGLANIHIAAERQQQLHELLHKTLGLRIIEVDAAKNRLILSERATQTDQHSRQQLLCQIRPGSRLCGRVTNLTDFGAFVDLGGVEGLVHISQLSWRRLIHPSDVVQPNQMLEVMVLTVDREKEHIALSHKQLLPDPWQDVEERYRPGQIVDATISNLLNFGALALVEPQMEGLIHLSELADPPPETPAAIVAKGDVVQAMILYVSSRERRLALSLHRANPPDGSASPPST